jgi:hypothetical protein
MWILLFFYTRGTQLEMPELQTSNLSDINKLHKEDYICLHMIFLLQTNCKKYSFKIKQRLFIIAPNLLVVTRKSLFSIPQYLLNYNLSSPGNFHQHRVQLITQNEYQLFKAFCFLSRKYIILRKFPT